MALKLGAALEPRMIMVVLTSVTDKVIREDDLLRRAWSDRFLQPKLRNPSSTWDIVDFVKIMPGGVRVRVSEEAVESRMRPTLTNKININPMATQMSAIPTAAGMEGATHNACQRLATEQ
eukprot:12863895-Prorocentrum_lima.AAC.1